MVKLISHVPFLHHSSRGAHLRCEYPRAYYSNFTLKPDLEASTSTCKILYKCYRTCNTWSMDIWRHSYYWKLSKFENQNLKLGPHRAKSDSTFRELLFSNWVRLNGVHLISKFRISPLLKHISKSSWKQTFPRLQIVNFVIFWEHYNPIYLLKPDIVNLFQENFRRLQLRAGVLLLLRVYYNSDWT